MEGVAKARNYGLRHATSEVIYFMDADDEIHPQLFQNIKMMFEKPIDILWFSYHYNTEKFDAAMIFKNQLLSGGLLRQEFLSLFQEQLLSVYYVWNKAFRRSFLTQNELTFPEGHYFGEDGIFCLRALNQANLVQLSSFEGYKYKKRNTSVTYEINMTAKRLDDEYQLSKELEYFLRKWNLPTEVAIDRLLWGFYHYLRQNKRNNIEKREIRKELKKIKPKKFKKWVQYVLCWVYSW